MQIVDQLSLEEVGRLLAAQTGITITVADDIRGTTLDDMSWHGTAAGALDSLSTRLGFRWRVRSGRVQIYYTDHQSWTIYAPVVSAQWQATVGLSGQVSGGGGSDLQARDQVVITMDTADFWPQLEDDGHRIAVTGRPLDAQPSDRRTECSRYAGGLEPGRRVGNRN